ncbi:hypothetical protein TNCV_987741 [Trichonephila clavipes]|nr:hypothetical protein TNCV_987741 [Trichonephila clavipes]
MHQEDLSLCFPVHSCCDLDEEGVYGEILTYRFAGEENGAFSLFLIRGCFCKSNSMCIEDRFGALPQQAPQQAGKPQLIGKILLIREFFLLVEAASLWQTPED